MELKTKLGAPVFLAISKEELQERAAVILTPRQVVNLSESGQLYIARQVDVQAVDASMIEASAVQWNEHER